MAKMDRQIRAHNNKMQCLHCRYRYDLKQFLAGGTGNFMITGGQKDRRRQVLLRQIEYYRQTSNSSVVIFSDDEVLKSQLINEAVKGTLGQLYIVNSEYNNYDFFHQMPLNLISEYFSKSALLRGYRDTAKLLTFTEAFLRVLEEDGSINMSIISDRLCYDNDTIRNATEQSDLRDMISSSADGASSLRTLMTATSAAFSPLTTRDCASGFNLRSELNNDCVILIKIPKDNHNLFAIYFAMELRSVMNESFKLILDDEIMLNNKELFDVVELLKQRNNVDVVVSYDNIIAIQPTDSDILKNFNSRIVFLNGKMPADDLQNVLSRYGQFTAMESVEHRDIPPAYLFTLLKGKGEAATVYQQDRAMLQNLTGEVVLSKGSSAEILAVRKLIM